MKWFSFSSLRVRLLLLVLFAVTPALVLTVYSGLKLRQHEIVEAEENTLRIVKLIADDYEQVIERARQILITITQIPSVRTYDISACDTLFQNLLTQYRGYTSFGIAGLDGNLFCSVPAATGSVNFADRPWFQHVLQTREFTIGDYQIGRITGKAVLPLSYPLLDRKGQVKAVVFVGLDLAWMNQLATELKLPERGTFRVIDRNGTIISHYPDPEKWAGKTIPETTLFKVILAQGEGFAEAIGLDGSPHLYAFTTIGGKTQGGKIYISISIPKSLAFAGTERILASNFIWLGLLAAISLAAAWFFGSFFILRQTNKLLETTKRLETGELSARANLSYGVSELSQLAHSFNKMAESLEKQEAERIRTEEEILRSHRDISALYTINRIASQSLEIEKMLGDALKATVEVMEFDAGGIYLLEPDGETLRLRVQVGLSEDFVKAVHRIKLGEGVSGRAAAEGKPVVMDVADYPTERLAPHIIKEGIHTLASTPLLSAGKLLGAMNLITLRPRGFSPGDLELLANIGRELGQTVDNAQLYNKTSHQLAELRSHHQVIRAILQTIDLDKRLSICLVETMQLVKAEMGGIYLVELDRLILRAYRGLPDDLLSTILDMPLTEMSWVSEIMVRRDRLSERGGQIDEIWKSAGVQSWMTIPMKEGDRMIGTLMLASRRYEAFSTNEIQALSTLAELVAVAIENARLYTEAQRRLVRLATLREIDRAIAAHLSLENVIRVILEQVPPHIVGVDAVGFSLMDWEKRGVNLAFLHLQGDISIQGEAFVLSESLLEWLVMRRKPVIIYDLLADPRVHNHRNVIREYKLKSYLGVPLIVQDQVIGILHILATQPRRFRDEEVDFFTTIAGQAAIAVRNAQLYQIILESEAKYRSLFENSRDVVYISSKDGSFIDINPAAVELFGYSKEELLSIKIETLYINDSERIKFMTEIEKRGFVKEYPIDLKKKDGTIISAFVTAAVRKDKNDNMIGYQGIIRDITERKLAEEKQKRLFREHQRLSRRLVEVQEMERRHIARELHDRISQNLTAVGINLNIFQNQLSAPLNPKIEAQLNDSMKLVEEMTVCIRDLMAELHPAVLDDYGLLAALHWYGERFSARTGIMIVLEGKELTPRLPLEVEIALFRIAQEALTNVVKYAQTDRVTVTLDRMTGGARLTIVDEGVGFDPKTLYQLKERSGWGLITMRERAEAVGGRLLMESSPGKGTKVIVEVLRWAIDFVKSPALPGDM